MLGSEFQRVYISLGFRLICQFHGVSDGMTSYRTGSLVIWRKNKPFGTETRPQAEKQVVWQDHRLSGAEIGYLAEK